MRAHDDVASATLRVPRFSFLFSRHHLSLLELISVFVSFITRGAPFVSRPYCRYHHGAVENVKATNALENLVTNTPLRLILHFEGISEDWRNFTFTLTNLPKALGKKGKLSGAVI